MARVDAAILQNETIEGTVSWISQPYTNGFRIATINPDSRSMVGVLGDLEIGDSVRANGRWDDNPTHGPQFKTDDVEVCIPKDSRGIKLYLQRHFPNVGPKIAERLVDMFGGGLWDVIEKAPEDLARIRGITKLRALEIHSAYMGIKADREYDVFFAKHKIHASTRDALVLVYKSKAGALRAIHQNPYILSDTVNGIGFLTADRIALSIGFDPSSPLRAQAAVKYVILNAAKQGGHSYLPERELIHETHILLGCQENVAVQAVSDNIESGALIREDWGVYDRGLHSAEQRVADKLRALATGPESDTARRELSERDVSKLRGDKDQVRAVELALKSRILILTGGPGTGKTTVIRTIISVLNQRRIELAAPTGKAAKRMFQATGANARTIHRLLEYNPITNGFNVNRLAPLTCDIVIIDEVSMMDIRLMADLLDAIVPSRTTLIMVGDVDQLPSVGPEKVLSDAINSGIIPVVTLRTNHRQEGDGALIIKNAHLINSGRMIELDETRKDFFFVDKNIEDIPSTIKSCCDRAIKGLGFSVDDIQVLCPQNKGDIGTKAINPILREILNPNGQKLPKSYYFKGDRVIQTKNNYKLDIYNGDIGKIEDIDSQYLYVYFDDPATKIGKRLIRYPLQIINQLSLAYALSIHKFQGSQTPCVIIPVHTTNRMMLRRNLIYTGVTRAERCAILVGSKKAMFFAVSNKDDTKRNSALIGLLNGDMVGVKDEEGAFCNGEEWEDFGEFD